MKTSIRTVALQLVMEESQSAQYGNKAQSPAATFFDSGDVDRVLGGAGRDILRGQAGDDRMEGGEDADFLYGWEGDDKLLAEADLTLEEALAQGESGPGSTDRGDFLQGNAGRDTVIGGAAKDLLSGGEGVVRKSVSPVRRKSQSVRYGETKAANDYEWRITA